MKIIVTAQKWDKELQAKFGNYGSTYNAPDSTAEFIEEMSEFGRFDMQRVAISHPWMIEFQNEYDD
ncbi:hypothetical protein UFOVP1290_178 [uncultured Caudovirales phage]|uniref:Uncharacterized protein n=1 Tax=uncultured Caudovirales phage TaxID=2100421 RepID=A0A6J5RSP2_9CAUD|nr:hypothetical protein UFOVP1290_178 [uncultured Caudovirales phage]